MGILKYHLMLIETTSSDRICENINYSTHFANQRYIQLPHRQGDAYVSRFLDQTYQDAAVSNSK